MKYKLNTISTSSTFSAIRKLWPMLHSDKGNMIFALIALLIHTGVTLVSPIVIGYTINDAIVQRNYQHLFQSAIVLLGLSVIGFVSSFFQIKRMGIVGQQLLFKLRSAVFTKLQELPLAFFNQNKTGDLISRINNDTDKLNDFFSRSLMQFIGNIFLMIGTAFFILFLNIRLGLAALFPALILLLLTRFLSPWIKRKNAVSLAAVGGMSSEIAESLENFKAVIAFNRQDYFRKRFQSVNEVNYHTSIGAGIANTIFNPLYGAAATIAHIIVLFYGIYLISQHQFTIGFLVSYFIYLTRFYDPIRHIAGLWSSFQVALAGWDRISQVLSLSTDLTVSDKAISIRKDMGSLAFRKVSFAYDGNDVLTDITFTLERGKTYAFVGPTGGGKTTTASLMARLYDPSSGTVYIDGKDIRSYTSDARTQKIGFILQEPFLFSGTVKENILYGNQQYSHYSDTELSQVIETYGLADVLKRFDHGLATAVTSHGETISLGQRQLIAFLRAALRKPEILILDEATANVDTMTEKILGKILETLPPQTTKVIIAHRLNTIENADEIFFVNAGHITRAGSFRHAVNMLLKGKRES